MSALPATRRPGAARNERARVAILKAAAELIAIHGYEHLTIEGIAARAKVGKPTIYRWWSSKSALIAECLVDEMLIPDTMVPANTGDIVADITAWLLEIIRFVNRDGNEVLLRSLVAAAIANREVGVQLGKHLGAGPDSLDGRLSAAVVSGQLAPNTAVQHISEFLTGVIIVRIVSGIGFVENDAATFALTVLAGSLTAGP